VWVALLLLSGAGILVDYPEEASVFPPEFPPPTFLWRDSSRADFWRIRVTFGDGRAAIHAQSRGAPPRLGVIDPDCVAPTNEPPQVTPGQHAWVPDAATWQTIKRRSTAQPAVVAFTGYRAGKAVSSGRVSIRTSRDPVGAPIFYRDVPLMPSEVEKGVIKPLAAVAVPLIAWRLRDAGRTRSRVVMDYVPVCANCHSFSADGKTMGMDLDGLHGNRGMYIYTSVGRRTEVSERDVLQWSTAEGRLAGKVRVGFLSQVSPKGEYVVTTLNPARGPDPPSNYYVANFKDYRFLQVFFPTRGYLAWYSPATGVLKPLPGADDPRYVQMGAVWSPDGSYLVFARAAAADPDPPGPPARFAGDPNELQIRYDLYRIPFNEGRGGAAEPVAGASQNGFSNTFPRISPDGRWMVFVRSRNGMLMRPDSDLYMVPAAGGTARRMHANTSRMNSWHSFSPNGRWMVFSSKARSPYTQMYLTHIDEQGNDTPAILIENATAANRAVNLPEFVNVPPGGFQEIGGRVLDYYRLVNSAVYLQKRRRYEEAVLRWKQVLELRPDDEMAHTNLGSVLLLLNRRAEAAAHRRRAKPRAEARDTKP